MILWCLIMIPVPSLVTPPPPVTSHVSPHRIQIYWLRACAVTSFTETCLLWSLLPWCSVSRDSLAWSQEHKHCLEVRPAPHPSLSPSAPPPDSASTRLTSINLSPTSHCSRDQTLEWPVVTRWLACLTWAPPASPLHLDQGEWGQWWWPAVSHQWSDPGSPPPLQHSSPAPTHQWVSSSSPCHPPASGSWETVPVAPTPAPVCSVSPPPPTTVPWIRRSNKRVEWTNNNTTESLSMVNTWKHDSYFNMVTTRAVNTWAHDSYV